MQKTQTTIFETANYFSATAGHDEHGTQAAHRKRN